MDAAQEMLQRYYQRNRQEDNIWLEGWKGNKDESLFQQPKLILNPEKTNFYDMTIDDFILVDYHPNQPQLKLELGI